MAQWVWLSAIGSDYLLSSGAPWGPLDPWSLLALFMPLKGSLLWIITYMGGEGVGGGPCLWSLLPYRGTGSSLIYARRPPWPPGPPGPPWAPWAPFKSLKNRLKTAKQTTSGPKFAKISKIFQNFANFA